MSTSPFDQFRFDFFRPQSADRPPQLVPVGVLPCQLAPGKAETPEIRLWRAVLEDAFTCLAGRAMASACGRTVPNKWRRRIAGETHAWVQSEADGVGSFVFCCQVLGIEPGRMRRRAEGVYRAFMGEG